MSTAWKVRALREKREWTPAQLAARANVPESVVLRAELGVHPITVAQRARLAHALGVTPEYLDEDRTTPITATHEWRQIEEWLSRLPHERQVRFLQTVFHSLKIWVERYEATLKRLGTP